MICIVGLAQSGKRSLFSALTGAPPEPAAKDTDLIAFSKAKPTRCRTATSSNSALLSVWIAIIPSHRLDFSSRAN